MKPIWWLYRGFLCAGHLSGCFQKPHLIAYNLLIQYNKYESTLLNECSGSPLNPSRLESLIKKLEIHNCSLGSGSNIKGSESWGSGWHLYLFFKALSHSLFHFTCTTIYGGVNSAGSTVPICQTGNTEAQKLKPCGEYLQSQGPERRCPRATLTHNLCWSVMWCSPVWSKVDKRTVFFLEKQKKQALTKETIGEYFLLCFFLFFFYRKMTFTL